MEDRFDCFPQINYDFDLLAICLLTKPNLSATINNTALQYWQTSLKSSRTFFYSFKKEKTEMIDGADPV